MTESEKEEKRNPQKSAKEFPFCHEWVCVCVCVTVCVSVTTSGGISKEQRPSKWLPKVLKCEPKKKEN